MTHEPKPFAVIYQTGKLSARRFQFREDAERWAQAEAGILRCRVAVTVVDEFGRYRIPDGLNVWDDELNRS